MAYPRERPGKSVRVLLAPIAINSNIMTGILPFTAAASFASLVNLTNLEPRPP